MRRSKLVVCVALTAAATGCSSRRDYGAYVQGCVDTLVEYGTDRYGAVHTPMMMAVIDVNNLVAPEKPLLLDAEVRTEGRPTHGRRSPGGSNLWFDMPLLRVMYRLSATTGDARYAEAADAYIRAVFEHAVKPDRDGLLAWGSHIYYNAYEDRIAGDGDGKGPHEILILHPLWDAMYRVDAAATRREIDAIWKWHIVDKTTGQHNRHDNGEPGADFAFSGGSFSIAFAFANQVTGDPAYLDKAKLVASWHWNHRDPETNLAPDTPGVDDFGGRHCFTTISGPHASQLLRCYELTGDAWFRDVAITYIKAYEKYGWDAQAGTYHGMLTLDGRAVPESAAGTFRGWQWAAVGPIDVWRTIMFSDEFPLIAAETSLYAYDLSGDPALLNVARHWASVVEAALPPHTGRRWKNELEAAMPNARLIRGTYAENYGRAISFFVSLYHATGDGHYRRVAESLADEAIAKLYVNGLFRGHPAKDYYEACDGVGLLLHALLELDALPDKWEPAF